LGQPYSALSSQEKRVALTQEDEVLLRCWIIDRLATRADIPTIQACRRQISRDHNGGIWSTDRPDTDVLTAIEAGEARILDFIIQEERKHVHPELAPQTMDFRFSRADRFAGPNDLVTCAGNLGGYECRRGRISTKGYGGLEQELYAAVANVDSIQISKFWVDAGRKLAQVLPRQKPAFASIGRDVLTILGGSEIGGNTYILDTWICPQLDPSLLQLNDYYLGEGFCQVSQRLLVGGHKKSGLDILATVFERSLYPMASAYPSSKFIRVDTREGREATEALLNIPHREIEPSRSISTTNVNRQLSVRQALSSGIFLQEMPSLPLIVKPLINPAVFSNWANALISIAFPTHRLRNTGARYPRVRFPDGSETANQFRFREALLAWEQHFGDLLVKELPRQEPLRNLRRLIAVDARSPLSRSVPQNTMLTYLEGDSIYRTNKTSMLGVDLHIDDAYRLIHDVNTNLVTSKSWAEIRSSLSIQADRKHVLSGPLLVN
jgi:hypothetical protein